jgi:hypothetical protein
MTSYSTFANQNINYMSFENSKQALLSTPINCISNSATIHSVVSTQYSVCDIHFCFVSHTLSVPLCKREHSLSVGTPALKQSLSIIISRDAQFRRLVAPEGPATGEGFSKTEADRTSDRDRPRDRLSISKRQQGRRNVEITPGSN